MRRETVERFESGDVACLTFTFILVLQPLFPDDIPHTAIVLRWHTSPFHFNAPTAISSYIIILELTETRNEIRFELSMYNDINWLLYSPHNIRPSKRLSFEDGTWYALVISFHYILDFSFLEVTENVWYRRLKVNKNRSCRHFWQDDSLFAKVREWDKDKKKSKEDEYG